MVLFPIMTTQKKQIKTYLNNLHFYSCSSSSSSSSSSSPLSLVFDAPAAALREFDFPAEALESPLIEYSIRFELIRSFFYLKSSYLHLLRHSLHHLLRHSRHQNHLLHHSHHHLDHHRLPRKIHMK